MSDDGAPVAGTVADGVSPADLEQDSSAQYESPRYQRWVAHTTRLLDIAAVIFLIDMLLIWSFPEADGAVAATLQGISWAVWGFFALDYLVRLALASHRRAFVRSHKADLAMVLLPMLRIMRVLLLIRRSLKTVSTERIASSIVSIAALIVVFGAFLVWRVESVSPDANIHTFRESLWWAIVTVTTVGYGNLYPVTPKGELIASGLMLVGISLIGTISATTAAWFVKRPLTEQDADGTGSAAPGTAASADAGTGGPADAGTAAPDDDAAADTAPPPDATAQILARLDALAAEQARLRELIEGRQAG